MKPQPITWIGLGALVMCAAAVSVVITAAQTGGYGPAPTPDPANVIVIPPSGQTEVEAILADPLVLTPRPTFAPNLPPPNYGALQPGMTAVVTQGPLNVRNVPRTDATAIVLTQLQRGDDVTVLSLGPDETWVYIDTRGPAFVQGWASAAFIEPFDATPDQFAPSLPDAAETGFTLIALETVNIRQEPVLFSERVGLLGKGDRAAIVGVTNTYSWWKIEVDGVVGWVAGPWIYPEQPAAYSAVPILQDP